MNELTFLDLVILKKVDSDSSVEKFGSVINTSFFETANLLGTVKIKGYINIESSLGGISKVTMTDAGNSLLLFAEQKAKEPIEPLDNAILHAVAGGVKEIEALQQHLNIRSGDLAYHINKLIVQGFMDYNVLSAKVYLVLTEQGFNSTGGVRAQQKLVLPEEAKSPLEASSEPPPFAQPASAAPPWVKESDVKEPEVKKDVVHLLHDSHSEEKKAMQKEEHKHGHKKGHETEAKKAARKPLTPEEEKALEQRRRNISKFQYYVSEYSPYVLLILVIIAIFIGAIFLSLGKLS